MLGLALRIFKSRAVAKLEKLLEKICRKYKSSFDEYCLMWIVMRWINVGRKSYGEPSQWGIPDMACFSTHNIINLLFNINIMIIILSIKEVLWRAITIEDSRLGLPLYSPAIINFGPWENILREQEPDGFFTSKKLEANTEIRRSRLREFRDTTIFL